MSKQSVINKQIHKICKQNYNGCIYDWRIAWRGWYGNNKRKGCYMSGAAARTGDLKKQQKPGII